MKFKLLTTLLFLSLFSIAQNPSGLKDFINKNNVAIRSVQKNMVAKQATGYANEFRTLLKQQEAAVKLYTTDQKASFALAYKVRTECLAFLKKYTKGSTEYFEINSTEKNTVDASAAASESEVLSDTEINAINGLDVTNFQSINTLSLTIQ